MRFLHVEDARHIENYRVRLEFNDGTHGIVDLSDSLDGKVFEPLKNLDFFKRFRLEGHTLAWENGADFAPEYLKSKSEQGGAGTALHAAADLKRKAASHHHASRKLEL